MKWNRISGYLVLITLIFAMVGAVEAAEYDYYIDSDLDMWVTVSLEPYETENLYFHKTPGFSPDETAVFGTDLEAFYPFEGNAHDVTSNGHDGTVYTAQLTTDRNGNPNSSYDFASQSYIDTGDTLMQQGPFTYSFWVETIEEWQDGDRDSNARTGWASYKDGASFCRVGYGCSGTALGHYSNWNTGWHQKVITYVGGNWQVYYDGSLKGSENSQLFTQGNDNWMIGRGDVSVPSYGNGKRDEIRIYTRVLNATEISNLYVETPPSVFITESLGIYNVTITNNINSEINNYQIRMPGSQVGVNSQDESWFIDDIPLLSNDTDLVIYPEDIIFSDETPLRFETIIITAIFHNLLDVSPPEIYVEFYDGHPIGGNLIGNDTIYNIRNDSYFAQTSWIAQEGDHDIYVYLDPNNEIIEADEENNLAFKQITVLPPFDIMITDDDVALTNYEPEANQDIMALAMLHNVENRATGDFTVTFLLDNATVIDEQVTSLNALQTKTLTTNFEAEEGYHEVFVYADYYDVVEEMNEDNNVGITAYNASPGPEPEVQCGDTITEDTVLTEDLSCTGVGLIIGADDITLDCNGYKISGDNLGGDEGIELDGKDNVVIKNCEIEGFYVGIFAHAGSDHNLIKNNYVHDTSNVGIYAYGEDGSHEGNTIHNNTIIRTVGGMIVNQGSNTEVSYNTIEDMSYYGLLLSYGTTDNTIHHNYVENCTTRGVWDRGDGDNLYYANVLKNNPTNAYEEVNGNHWNNSIEGNDWDDFESNAGYPTHYVIDGSGNGIDWKPVGAIVEDPWDHKIPLYIYNSAGDQTDYQIRIDLNSSNLNQTFNWSNNGEDIRFTDSNDDPIYFWIENFDPMQEEAIVWVKVPFLADENIIYMLYGNDEAVSASDGPNTWIFYDEITEGDTSWIGWGSPIGVISTDFGNPAPSLKGNGDGSYGSGIGKNEAWDVSEGRILTMDYYSSTGGVGREGGCGLSRINASSHTSSGLDSYDVAYIGFMQPPSPAYRDEVFFMVWNGTHEKVVCSWSAAEGNWYKMTYKIAPDYAGVEIYQDDEFKCQTDTLAPLPGYLYCAGHDPNRYGDNFRYGKQVYPEPVVSFEQQETPTCTDTDGGFVIDVYGSIVCDYSVVASDQCSGTQSLWVHEYTTDGYTYNYTSV
ncbi:MAG: DUF2341 domain-containing protein, partial [archaeon]